MKKFGVVIAILMLQLMLVGYGTNEDTGDFAFTSGGTNADSPQIYMLLTDGNGNVVSNISHRQDNESNQEIASYEAVELTKSGLGFSTEEGGSDRTYINVYRPENNSILVIRNNAIGAAGPNHPRSENYFTLYDYSSDTGFVESFSAKLIDEYGNFDGSVYTATDRACYIDDNMVAMQDFFSQLSSNGIVVKSADIETNELRDTPQSYEVYLADLDDCCIFSMMDRDADIPENIYTYLGIDKTEVTKDEKAAPQLEGTLSDEEIEAAAKAAEEREKARIASNDDIMPLGECLLRIFATVLIILFTVVTLLFAFSSPFITLAIDMFVLFIGLTVFNGDRMMAWLKLDFENVWILFVLFFAGIMGCCVFDWEKLAGVIYVVQMVLISLAVSGIVSERVMNSWVHTVGLYVALPPAAFVALFIAIFIGGPFCLIYCICKAFF